MFHQLLLYLPSHNSPHLEVQSPFPLSLSLYQCAVFLLQCHISPASNHSFELLVTEYSHLYVWWTQETSICSSLVNLSFFNLIYRPQPMNLRWVEERNFFLPCSYFSYLPAVFNLEARMIALKQKADNVTLLPK